MDKLDPQTKLTVQNCELLRHCFNTLQAVIAERSKDSGADYCNATILAAAAKQIYERWEREKHTLRREDLRDGNKSLLRQDFYPEDLPFPREIQDKICAEIHQSTWYKMVWGNAHRR